MPDKKLTDAEIVKALENEIHLAEYVDSDYCCNTEVSLLKSALDLINRLQADCENYKQIAENQQSITLDRGFEIKRLKEEIERLKREIEDLESVQEISPEAKYLVDTKADKVISLLIELNKSQEQIKAEAYKECVEKVKEEINEALKNNYKVRSERAQSIPIYTKDEFWNYCAGKIDCLRGIDDFLDNLLKELVGDNNDL